MKRIENGFGIYQLENAKDLPIPKHATERSAGRDLYANINESIILEPGKRVLIPTGIKLLILYNHEVQIRPRSGLALKFGITVLNSPGTIDADYHEEVGVILINHGDKNFTINRGDRIAQMVLNELPNNTRAEIFRIDTLTEYIELSNSSSTSRTGGFGHTGLHPFNIKL